MGLFKKWFGTGKQDAKAQTPAPPTKKEMEALAPLMTGQLVALFKETKEQAYQQEYLRRLQHIGFTPEEAMNFFMYESLILKHDSLELLCRKDYLGANYFNLKTVLLPREKKDYIDHQSFLCSEITKIWDEAEWHYRSSHEKDLSAPVWQEIYKLTRYGGGELFIEYLQSMAEHTKTDFAKVQKYSMAEQGMLFKYKWNAKAGEKHPYQ